MLHGALRDCRTWEPLADYPGIYCVLRQQTGYVSAPAHLVETVTSWHPSVDAVMDAHWWGDRAVSIGGRESAGVAGREQVCHELLGRPITEHAAGSLIELERDPCKVLG